MIDQQLARATLIRQEPSIGAVGALEQRTLADFSGRPSLFIGPAVRGGSQPADDGLVLPSGGTPENATRAHQSETYLH